jgi:hypothetical protein
VFGNLHFQVAHGGPGQVSADWLRRNKQNIFINLKNLNFKKKTNKQTNIHSIKQSNKQQQQQQEATIPVVDDDWECIVIAWVDRQCEPSAARHRHAVLVALAMLKQVQEPLQNHQRPRAMRNRSIDRKEKSNERQINRTKREEVKQDRHSTLSRPACPRPCGP